MATFDSGSTHSRHANSGGGRQTGYRRNHAAPGRQKPPRREAQGALFGPLDVVASGPVSRRSTNHLIPKVIIPSSMIIMIAMSALIVWEDTENAYMYF